MELLSALLQDLRHSFRRLRKTPRFLGSATLILGLSLGAHMAVVGVIDAVLLTPLPVQDPGQLLNVHETRDGDDFRSLSYLDYLVYKEQSKAFSELAAHYSTARLHIDYGGASEMLNGAIVSGNYFSLLGVEPERGRSFLPEEDATPGTHPVVVLSDSLWRLRLGADEGALGSTIKINNQIFTVVGIAPPNFVGLDASRPCLVWMPTMMAQVGNPWCDGLSDPGCRSFEMVGRLAEGRDTEDARTEMDRLAQSLHRPDSLDTEIGRGFKITPLVGFGSERGQTTRQIVSLLLAVVALVVLVACANLAGLLISRSLNRRREMAVRLALGAPRMRVVSLVISEALILAMAGGIVGLVMASWAGPLGTLAFQTRVPVEVDLDAAFLAKALILCTLVGLAVGVLPGLQASRSDLVSSLRTAAADKAGRSRSLAVFVTIQLAATFVLLHSTLLLGRSVVGSLETPAVDPASVATFRLHPRFVSYSPEQADAVVREVLREMRTLPDVRSIGFAKHRPLWPGFTVAIELPGEPSDSESTHRTTGLQPVAPGTFDSLGISVLRGRDFESRDVPGATPVLVINRTLAESLWPEDEAVGRRVTLRQTTYEVIGVVQDCPYRRLIQGRSPEAFSSFWQDLSHPDARFTVRFDGDAAAHLAVLQNLVYRIDPSIPVTEVGTLEEQVRNDLASVLSASRLAGFTGVLAVVLSAAGLGGVLALAVAHRRRELGIRKALGASQGQIVGLVVKKSAFLTIAALAFGLLAAAGFRPAIDHFLYGVAAHDPWALGGAVLVIPSIAMLASWLPARRAAAVDPVETIRDGPV